MDVGTRPHPDGASVLVRSLRVEGLQAVGATSSFTTRLHTAQRSGQVMADGAEQLPMPVLLLNADWRFLLTLNGNGLADTIGPTQLVVLRIPVGGRRAA